MGKSQVQQLLNPSRLQHLGEDPLAEPPVEGEPKTAETPEDIVPKDELLKELDISSSLSQV